MKVINGNLIDKIVTPTLAQELGNAARLLLKREVIVLRLKNNKVLEDIRQISRV
jgi:hypothetical protein